MAREIKIEGSSYSYTVEQDQSQQKIMLPGSTHTVRYIPLPDGRSLCLVGGRVVENVCFGNDSLRIVRKGGRLQRLKVTDPLTRRSAHSVGNDGDRAEIKAPMPGKVVRVLCAPGDIVEADQGIIVLEAMKMENELRTPLAGTVQLLDAGIGDLIEMGHLVAVVVPQQEEK